MFKGRTLTPLLGHDFGRTPMGLGQVLAASRRMPPALEGYEDDEQQPHETPQVHVVRELSPGDRILSWPRGLKPWVVLRTPRHHIAVEKAA